MTLIKFTILWIFCLLLISCFVCAQNLALNKSYTLSALPNYEHSAPPSDKSSLTDGIYTNEHYWTTPTTLGWEQLKQITITIDLELMQPVGSIIFNTVRNINAGINFPQNIYVFISRNNKNFRYVGDAANTPDNIPGSFEIKKFILNGINDSARYVSLAIVPRGLYLFCDEIEVLKGKSTEKLKRNSWKENVETNKELLDVISQLNKVDVSQKDIMEIKNRIGKEHASDLRRRFRVPFIVEKYNPWDSLSEFREPIENSSILNYQFSIPKDGVQYGSFVITNCNSSDQRFSFKVSNANTTLNSIELFNVPYVPSSNFIWIPDPLVPIKNNVTIKPGISEMFIFKITGINKGDTKFSLIIHSAGNKDLKLNIDAQILNLFTQNYTDNLNANVWAYLYYPLLNDRRLEAAKDLKLHHINTIVIPPAILPTLGTVDYTIFINYLINFKSIKNILFFMNYTSAGARNGYKEGQFMSPQWKNNFIIWYDKMIKLIDDNGFPNTQVYLYPYDEVRSNNINDFKNLVIWAKTALPEIKFYATLDNKEAIDSILPLVDIAQINSASGRLKELSHHKGEIWSYNTTSSTRSLSPYKYYRLMGWEAFAHDYKGIGFWNYADIGKNKNLNFITAPMQDPVNYYSVIYDGPGKEIISSRRWEAFSLGIEDYSILQAYAKKYRLKNAKAFAEKVVSNPVDLNLADKVRDKMITEISAK